MLGLQLVEPRVAGASRDVSSIAASQALSALAVLLLLSAAATWWTARHVRRFDAPPAAWFAGFASVALVGAVTLFRYGFPSGFSPRGLGGWSSDGLDNLSRDPLGSSQFILNIVLFVPAGLIWTWVIKRPVAVLLALCAGSLLIELVQGVTGAGAPDVADLAANSAGAAIGVGVGVAIATMFSGRQIRMSQRSQRLVGAVALIVVVVTIAGWFVGASRRQHDVEEGLRARFAGTTRADIEAMLETDPGAVFGALTDYSDGTRYSDSTLEIRYPATFFSLHRCVYVVWSDTAVDFRRASGDDCTDFIDGVF